MDIAELIDAAKAGIGVTSDYALAQKLKVSRSAVSQWRDGKHLPNTEMCGKLAVFSGIPLHKVLGTVGEAREISPAAKKVWRQLAAAMFVALVVVALPASASNFPTNGQSACTLCEVLERVSRDVSRGRDQGRTFRGRRCTRLGLAAIAGRERSTTTRLRGLAWRLEAEQREERARTLNASREER